MEPSTPPVSPDTKPAETHFAGGCACGALRYVIAGTPVFQNHCACRDCQRRSGTGHGSWITFAHRAAADITGPAHHWTVAGDSGNAKTQGFCPTCGTPVTLTFAAMPDLISVAVASLDDPARFRPQVLTYALRTLPWDVVDPALPRFDRMPQG